jgi:energy-coupling factor transporter ATP-binding protein EcfA2
MNFALALFLGAPNPSKKELLRVHYSDLSLGMKLQELELRENRQRYYQLLEKCGIEYERRQLPPKMSEGKLRKIYECTDLTN